jgi:hypothetical protein
MIILLWCMSCCLQGDTNHAGFVQAIYTVTWHRAIQIALRLCRGLFQLYWRAAHRRSVVGNHCRDDRVRMDRRKDVLRGIYHCASRGYTISMLGRRQNREPKLIGTTRQSHIGGPVMVAVVGQTTTGHAFPDAGHQGPRFQPTPSSFPWLHVNGRALGLSDCRVFGQSRLSGHGLNQVEEQQQSPPLALVLICSPNSNFWLRCKISAFFGRNCNCRRQCGRLKTGGNSLAYSKYSESLRRPGTNW